MSGDDLQRKRSEYEPARYWSTRLGKDFSLKGVGHQQYTEAYNRWIYLQKARTLRRVLPPVPAGGRALDVGSGIGWVVNQLREAGWRTDGCDIAAVAVDRLTASFAGSDFFEYAFGAGPLPREDASYDLVTMLDVSYHVVDDDLWA